MFVFFCTKHDTTNPPLPPHTHIQTHAHTQTICSQRPLFININAGVLLENGKAWNIRKVSRHADAYMILEGNVLRFYGFLMIDKVDVSVHWTNGVEHCMRMDGWMDGMDAICFYRHITSRSQRRVCVCAGLKL